MSELSDRAILVLYPLLRMRARCVRDDTVLRAVHQTLARMRGVAPYYNDSLTRNTSTRRLTLITSKYATHFLFRGIYPRGARVLLSRSFYLRL